MNGNDLDQGLALVTVSISVMFAFPLVMARLENSLDKPARTRGARRRAPHAAQSTTPALRSSADADETAVARSITITPAA